MKKLTLFILGLFLLPQLSFAAVEFGKWVGGTVQGGSSGVNITGSITATSTTPTLVCNVRYNSTSVSVSSLNWDNGSGGSVEAFTQLGNYQNLDTNNARMSLWYVQNANKSNSRVILTNSGSTDTYLSCSHFSGGDSWDTATGVANTSDPSLSRTSSRDGSLHVGGASSGNGGLGSGANTVEGSKQSNNTDVVYASSNTNNGDSQTLNWSGGGSAGAVSAMLMPLAEVTAGPAQDLIFISDE